MTPLEQIRSGLEQKDFNLIAAGYKLMTGKVVEIGSAIESEPESQPIHVASKRGRKPKVQVVKDAVVEVQGLRRFKKDGPIQVSPPKLVTNTTDNIDKKEIKANKSNAAKIEKEKRPLSKDWMKCGCGRNFNISRFTVSTNFKDNKVVRNIECPQCKKQIEM